MPKKTKPHSGQKEGCKMMTKEDEMTDEKELFSKMLDDLFNRSDEEIVDFLHNVYE